MIGRFGAILSLSMHLGVGGALLFSDIGLGVGLNSEARMQYAGGDPYLEELEAEIHSAAMFDPPTTEAVTDRVETIEPIKPQVQPRKNSKPSSVKRLTQPDQTTTVQNHPTTNIGGGSLQGSPVGFATSAIPIRAPKPAYPADARRSNFEGAVELALQISSDGRVNDISVLRSSGREDCDRSARDTILREWRFTPARIAGLAVDSARTVRVRFEMS